MAIARALANDPEIILADEPTGNLDTKTGEHVMKLLSKLNKDGKTIILIKQAPDIATKPKNPDSNTNISKTSLFLAPIAFIIPISLTLSRTEVIVVFAVFIADTNTEINAINITK